MKITNKFVHVIEIPLYLKISIVAFYLMNITLLEVETSPRLVTRESNELIVKITKIHYAYYYEGYHIL